MDAQGGFLLIGSDIAITDETDYLHWLSREHAAERLAIPGFRSVRVFRREERALAQFLIFYRLASPAIARSPDYLARLDHPTEWSQRIMPRLQNFLRGAGAIRFESGAGEGMAAAAVLFAPEQLAAFTAAAEEIAQADRIVSARVIETDATATEIATREKSLRQGDRSFPAMLLIEALDEAALAPVKMLGAAALEPPKLYRQIFALNSVRQTAGHHNSVANAGGV
jgi:hypothetical protein